MSTSEIVFLPWCDAFAVGHSALDEEHRALVKLINDVHAVEQVDNSYEKLYALASKLEFATIEHFRHENYVLRLELAEKLPASQITEHMAEHAVALGDLKSIIRNHRRRLSSSLSADLKNWFVNHTAGHDAHIREIVQRK